MFGLSKEEEQRALDLHQKLVIINASTVIKYGDEHFDLVKKGGVTASNHTVTCPSSSFTKGVKEVNECLKWLRSNAHRSLLVRHVEDIYKAKSEGKDGLILGPQNANLIENNLDLFGVFQSLGVTIMQLTYNELNFIGAGCTEKRDPGLSKFGVQVVEEMNRLGIVIDLSHCGLQTTNDAIAISANPVIFSHASPYSLCANVRNKTDEQIKALAEKGGVIGITAYGPITKKESRATMDDFFAHVDYVVNLVGIDHVGIGTDHDETLTVEALIEFEKAYPEVVGIYTHDKGRWIEGMESVTCFPEITKGLIARGYSDDDIAKIMGDNFLRVFKKVCG